MFGASADKISTKYEVPIVSKFELSGTNNDVEYFKERVRRLRHIELNNEITQMQDGFYQLHKDKEALEVFMEEAREYRSF